MVDEYPKDYVNAGELTPREAGLKAHREAEQKIIQAQQKIQPNLEVVETMTVEEKSKKEEDCFIPHLRQPIFR